MTHAISLEQVITFLLETPMFAGLGAGELSELVHIMQIRRLREGQVLFREGDEGDGWYVVYAGKVLVEKGGDLGPPREITALGPRACFGEMSVLDGRVRSATVRASDGCVVFRFPRYDFEQLLRDGNVGAYKIVREMAKILSQRQRQTTARLSALLQDRELAARDVEDAVGPLLDDLSLSE